MYTDTDFAGCPRTRRSTNGGCALRGAHLVKRWAVTQKALTLSSGEAELGGVVKGAAEGLVHSLHGSHSGVMGLPLYETRALLKSAGFPIG